METTTSSWCIIEHPAHAWRGTATVSKVNEAIGCCVYVHSRSILLQRQQSVAGHVVDRPSSTSATKASLLLGAGALKAHRGVAPHVFKRIRACSGNAVQTKCTQIVPDVGFLEVFQCSRFDSALKKIKVTLKEQKLLLNVSLSLTSVFKLLKIYKIYKNI